MKYLLGLVCLFFIGCASKPFTPPESWPVHECGPIPGVDKASYCYDESAAGATDVLWWMHGLGDSNEVWKKPTTVPSSYPDLIAQMPPMRIITISFSEPVMVMGKPFESGWMLTGYPNRTKEPVMSTLDVFKNKIVPFIEAKYKMKGPYKIAGHSMGGSNVAQVVKAFPEMWSKAVIINPALVQDSVDPWNFVQLCPWCLMIKANYDSKAQWLKDRPEPIKGKKVMVTGCPLDIFLLYPAAQEYAQKAGIEIQEDPPVCTHWKFPVSNILKFLKD